MIAHIMQKMIEYSGGSLHDINHFIKVHSYARTIALLEGLDENTRTVLEAAAIVHDIACPKLREKNGRADGKLQETEGAPMAESLLQGSGLTGEQIARVVFLVAHHHTPEKAEGVDYRILLEADYLVNADESGYTKDAINNAYENLFKTASGKQLLKNIYLF